MEYTVKIFDRPVMENPVYRMVVNDKNGVREYFIQRRETNDYDEWNSVVFDGMHWEAVRFLGFTKKEAINILK